MGANRQFDKNSRSLKLTKRQKYKTKKQKMKFSFTLIAAAFAAEDNVTDDTWVGPLSGNSTTGAVARSGVRQIESGERRYDDLEAIAAKYWRKQGATGKDKFDERKYWTYGCHCFLLGDRPMSEMGKGKPVDALDNKCKAYKDCQKCVRAKHGDQCIGEFVRYTWKYSSKVGDFVSANDEGSCERELYECDVQFVKDTFANKDVFNEDYHAFWSTTGFDNRNDDSCPSGGSAPVEHQCCGGVDGPWYWIGLNNQKCCGGDAEGNNGSVVGINDQC